MEQGVRRSAFRVVWCPHSSVKAPGRGRAVKIKRRREGRRNLSHQDQKHPKNFRFPGCVQILDDNNHAKQEHLHSLDRVCVNKVHETTARMRTKEAVFDMRRGLTQTTAGDLKYVVGIQTLEDIAFHLHKIVGDKQGDDVVVPTVQSHIECHHLAKQDHRVAHWKTQKRHQ